MREKIRQNRRGKWQKTLTAGRGIGQDQRAMDEPKRVLLYPIIGAPGPWTKRAHNCVMMLWGTVSFEPRRRRVIAWIERRAGHLPGGADSAPSAAEGAGEARPATASDE